MVNKLLNYRIVRSSIAESNEWIVFLHGIGGSSAIWFKQISTFRKYYNLLLIDLPGHGKGNLKLQDLDKLSFNCVSYEVIKVLDYLKIKKANFIGFSLGTIVIQEIKRSYPDRVNSIILAGAVEKLNMLLKLGVIALGIFINFIPHMILYKVSAYLIAPGKKNSKSRNIFVKEASKIDKNEFKNWYKIMIKSLNIFKTFNTNNYINSLYIMGEKDTTFLPAIIKREKNIKIIKECGHVCNVERWEEFNIIVINFLESIYEFRIVS